MADGKPGRRLSRNLRLRQARAEKGWTQPELARRAKVATATVNQAETGRRVPFVVSQQKIARALGVPREWLFPEDEVAQQQPKEPAAR